MTASYSNTLSLNGEWSLFFSDGMRGAPNKMHSPDYRPHCRLNAMVPGEVHLDLMRQGLIDDIYQGDNFLKARWVEEYIWAYEKVFALPKKAVGKRCFLEFSCLDYTAEIYLNGTLAGRHANFFRPCRLEVTGLIQPGDNRLVVRLDSGLYSVSERPITPYMDATMCPDRFLHKRIWLRKPQSSFGWDWAPRMVNVGIQGSVRLSWDDGIAVEDSNVRTMVSDNLSTGYVIGKAVIQAAAAGQANLTLTLSRNGRHIDCAQKKVEVSMPQLWFPSGYGMQPLYDVCLTLTDPEGEVLFESQKQVGFRKVVVDQSPHPQQGRYFILTVNDIRIFVKGANMVPADMILANINRRRYETLISRAKEANMNFLRVWGGGVYESDDFYELCDREGILVWQEFIFACATYPATDKGFLDEVKREATYQIRRLSHHPSLVVWCGNNEIDAGVQAVTQGDQYTDYALYHHVLPSILSKEDPDRYYQPSSPYSMHSYDQGFNLDAQGDQHPWYIGTTGGQDFFTYRDLDCRFADEGGFLGPNSLPALYACMDGQQRRVHSYQFELHDNMMSTCAPPGVPPDEAFPLWYGRDIREGSLEDYCYLGGFLQGEAFAEYIANFRRRKFDSAAAVFWMYNDCWDCSRSWTVVDYRLNRTPSFHPVRRAFAPVAVFLAREGDVVQVYGVNDTLEDFHGSLDCGIVTSDGRYLDSQDKKVTIPANASRVIGLIPLTDNFDPHSDLPYAFLYDAQQALISRVRRFEVRYHTFCWRKPKIEISRQKGRICMTSDVFVGGVCLDLNGDRRLTDNFFDLYPGVPYFIAWDESYPLPKLLHLNEFLMKE